MKTPTRSVSIVLSLLILAGCAAGISGEALLKESRAVFGEKEQSFLFYVPSSGPIADATFIALSHTTGPSAMAQEIAKLLARGESGELRLAIAGDNSAKTQRVVLDALKLNEGKKLKGLELLLIGSSDIRNSLQEATEKLGGTFYFRPGP
ncbi:MAG: hypothetical protein HYU47_15455 [Deltaproteobacteria bacterium]|nr:hypothetical protein [Deltaproteobacteria bacterium]